MQIRQPWREKQIAAILNSLGGLFCRSVIRYTADNCQRARNVLDFWRCQGDLNLYITVKTTGTGSTNNGKAIMPRIRNRSTKDFTTNKKEELGPRTKSLRNWKRVWFLAVHVEHRRSKLNKLSCNQLLLWFSCCFYSINVINYLSDTSFCLQELNDIGIAPYPLPSHLFLTDHCLSFCEYNFINETL